MKFSFFSKSLRTFSGWMAAGCLLACLAERGASANPVQGRITARGFPVPNALVTVVAYDTYVDFGLFQVSVSGWQSSGYTDGNGYYSITGPAAPFGAIGQDGYVVATKSGYSFGSRTVYDLDGGTTTGWDLSSSVAPAPVIGAISAASSSEDTPLTVSLSGIEKGDRDLNETLSVTATSANTAVAPNPTVTYTSPNSTGSLLLTPTPNGTGASTITVTVTRQDGTTAQRTFTYTVNAVNDAPVAGPATSLKFRGGGVATLPAVALANSSFTIEFWNRRTRINTWDLQVFQGTGLTDQGLHIGFRPGNTFTMGFWGDDIDTPAYTDLDWHHWACTFDVTTKARKIYRDGVVVASGNSTGVYIGTGAVSLASDVTGAPGQFETADFRIWSGVRSQTEIQNNRNVAVSPKTPNLLVNYRFNEGSGLLATDLASSSSAPDQGGAQNATLPADALFLGPIPQNYVQFSLAASQKIVVTNFGTLLPNNPITIEFWQRVDAAAQQSSFVISADANNRINAHVPWEDGVIYWDFGNIVSGPGRLQYTPPESPVGKWNHFAFVADATEMRIYRNGVLESSKASASPFSNHAGNLEIKPGGRMADFRIWTVKRTAAEIAANRFAPVAPDATGLLLNYLFTETNGTTTVADRATLSGAQTGYIVNGASFTDQADTKEIAWRLNATEDSSQFVNLPAADVDSSITYSSATALNGSLLQLAGGDFLYTPNSSYSGTDQINYTVSDGSLSSSGSMNVTVSAVNDPPVVGPGTAISLNGSSQYLDAPDGIWFTNTFTVESWVFVRSYTTWSRLFDFGNGAGIDTIVGALTEGTSGKPVLAVYQGTAVSQFTSSQAIPLNTWTHLAFTRDAGGIGHIYLNGVQTASGALLAPNAVVRTLNYIGRSNWSFDAYADAKFANLRFWNTARTSDELKNNWNPSLLDNTAGLIANYRLNEGSGVTAFDSATGDGAQNLAVIGNPAWLPEDAPANSISFNGTTQYGQTLDSAPISMTGPFTLEAWVRPAAIGATMGIIEKYGVNDGGYYLRLDSNGRISAATVEKQFNAGIASGNTTLAAGIWYHVAATFDGTLVRVYVNGVLDGAAVASRLPKDGTTPLYVGAVGDNTNLKFNGRIGDVRVWNVARTGGEIAAFQGGVATNATGLVLNYRMDDLIANELKDAAIGDGLQNASLNGSPALPGLETSLANLEVIRYTEDTTLQILLPAFDVETNALTWSAVTASTGSVTQVSAGIYNYTPPANYNGPASISYTVSDGTTPVRSTVYLQGIPVEDGPTLDVIPNQLIGENSPTTYVGITFTDGDPELTQNMTVTATSNNTNLIGNPRIDYTSPAETAVLGFKPRAGMSGSATVTVTVTDLVSTLTATRNFTITVSPVDDTPNVGPATSLAFNGTNYVTIPNFGTVAPLDEITVEFWQNVSGIRAQSAFQLAPDDAVNRLAAQVPGADGKVTWDFGNSTATIGRLAYTPPVSITNTWQHFAFVASRSGNYMKIFRNGIEEATKPGVSTIITGTKELRLGLFVGELAEFRVWKVARTSDEILAAMHSSLPNTNVNLVAYYRFNQRPTVSLVDFASLASQGGAQDGTLVPAPSIPDDIDPRWQTTVADPAPGSAKSWQSSSAALKALQVVTVGDGTTNNVFLPAWDAENGLTLTWSSVSASTGSVSVISGGLWAYKAPSGYNGPATITYSVKDSTTTNPIVTASINLRVVVAQNDPPTISLIPNKAAEEDSTLIEIPFRVDDDQPATALTITPQVLENGDLIQSVAVPAGGNFRVLNVVPKAGVIGTVHLRLIVRDAGNKTAQTEFDLRIEPKPAFSVVDLGLLPGKSASFGTAVNDRGAVTGYMADTADLESNPLGFFYNGLENGGNLSQVGPFLGNGPFKSFAINNSYTLAGSGVNGPTVAWTKGHESAVSSLSILPGGSFAEIRSLNDAGMMVGNANLSTLKKRAVSFSPGGSSLVNLGVAPAPFDDQSEAFGLNISNRIVGAISAASGARRAMLLSDTGMQPLFDVPDDTNSVANSINAFDQVVGRATSFAAGDSAMGFDGVDDTIVQTNLLVNPTGTTLVAGNAAHTVEAWIKVGALPANRSWPILLGTNTTGAHHWIVNGTSLGSKLQVGIFNGGSVQIPFTVGAWMHVAVTYDPPTSNLVAYVNGQPFGTNVISVNLANLQGIPLSLSATNDNRFNGALDEVRVWKTTRTAAQIADNYTVRLAGNETGLVVYFPFDEASGATTTSEATGSLIAGISGNPTRTVRGGLPAPSLTISDSALQLDGFSSQVSLPSYPLANSSFTIEVRARRAGIGRQDYVIGQGAPGITDKALHIGFRPSNVFTFAFWSDDLNSPVYTDTDWHHWACVFDAATKARMIFRDGTLVASNTATANYQGSGPMALGRAMFDQNFFKGTMDDLRIWNVARTADQIRTNIDNRFAGNTPGLLAYYLFDEGGGNTTVNRATGLSDATLQGAINWVGRDTGASRAFLYETLSGRLSSLGTLTGGSESVATAINDFGQIAGTVNMGIGTHAFFHSAGKLNDLNDLLPEIDVLDQWTLESASGINRSGAVVGTGTHGGLKRAYLALPATVIGRPVIRPQGAVAKYPQITLLKKHREDDTIFNAFYWSEPEKRLYAIRPVTAKIEWYNSFSETTGTGTNLTANTERIVSVTVNIWPKQPRIHIAGAPVDLQPAYTAQNYSFQSLLYVTNSASVEPSLKVFTSPTPGYTVAHYLQTSGLQADPLSQPSYFEVIRTVTWNDSHAGLTESDWTIGAEVTEPGHTEYDNKNGYVLFEKAAYDSVGADRAYDRGTRLGPILPVNVGRPGNNTNANSDDLIVVWYRTNRIGVAWASVPIRYSLKWPADDAVDKIIIASQLGSGFLSAADYPAKKIYNQPDITQAGFNPNEEHAYMPDDTLYAIRDDLNDAKNYSKPYALLKFRDPGTSRWRMRVFKVIAEEAPYFFRYTGTVGKEVKAPLPLSLMPLCSGSYQTPTDSEVGWKDFKGKFYAKQAGPQGTHTNLLIRWFYPMQPGFYHPDNVAVGDCLAWLDQREAGALQTPNGGLGAKAVPIDVTYDIRWDAAPILQVGETLAHSKRGMPDVFNMAHASVIFDSLSAATGNNLASLARFYDPISARTITSGVVIPAGLKRQNIAGKEYFVDLPWFIKIRLSYDPINNWLSFGGYLDENFGVGEPLLLPNILTERESRRIKDLAKDDTGWSALIDRLYDLTRNPNGVDIDPVDGIPDKDLRFGYKTQALTNFYTVPIEHQALVTKWAFTTNYILPPPFNVSSNAYSEVDWVDDTRKKPDTLEEALETDAKVLRDLALKGTYLYRVKPGATLNKSYSITTNLAPEIFFEGPKVLTAGFGGVPAAAAKPGNALSFNGTSGVVTVGLNGENHIDLTGTPFTIEFWAKVNSPLTEQYLFSQASGSPNLGQLRLGFRNGGQFAFDLGTTPASISIFNTGDTYTDTGWHHWAATFDPETKVQSIYRDGLAVMSRTNASLNYIGFGVVELGHFGTNYFAGQIDEFRIWKTARTGSEIRLEMNKRLLGSGVEPKLELLYRCDESAGPLLNDSFITAGAYTGTLSGGVSLVASTAPTGIPPRYVTIAENNSPALGGLPVALHVIRVDDGPFRGDIKVLPGDNVFDERLTMRHSSDFGGDPGPLTFQWYYKPIGADFDPTDLPIVTDATAPFPTDMRGWTPYSGYKPVDGHGVNYVTIGEGGESGLITLSDNAFICRYKGYAINLDSSSTWSGWVGDPTSTPDQPRAALAEGWVKRVIRGLNPFDARTADFHSSPSQTFASMLIQAGHRYEGPIAFNPSADAINKVGLIEAYTTVLERAKGLSIEGVPPVDFNPANNALLLAATKISDLYTLLGNEAYADASDPTIGFGSGSKDYGSLASSIFAFQNQLDSLLEEELTLLRGRDDSAAGVGANPVYNRLFWNFTLGEGEVAYQQNYNISDQDNNGFINEKDARILYPQGHGDAWGHYLEAIKQHYALLKHPYFTWIPRSELVAVAGAAIKVDFLDERKFATMAAAKAKAGAEIVDLTYRLNYVDDPAGQWQGYKDTKPDRAWGVTEWSRRAGMGAYFDWLTANTILPSVDPNPNHTGIDKIDRQTVREIQEIPAQYAEIQTRLDQADAGLNPLGLAKGVVPFDIDPSLVTAVPGKTHYEQIQDRALKAMNNAISVWDEVNKSTEALRRNQDSVEQLTSNVNDQERDYKNRLIEIYGYPYAGDIGAGKTYPSGYDGPDLYHYMYVPVPDFDGARSTFTSDCTGYFTQMNLGIDNTGDSQSGAFGSANASFFFPGDFASDLANATTGLSSSNRILQVIYPRTTARYAFSPPTEWGLRRAPGEIQMALSDLIQTEARLRAALKADDALFADIDDRIKLLNARYDLRAQELKLQSDLANVKISFATAIIALKVAEGVYSKAGEFTGKIGDAVQEALPTSVGLSSDVTSGGRSAIKFGSIAISQGVSLASTAANAAGQVIEKIGLPAAEGIVNAKIASANFTYEIRKQVDELERILHQIAISKLEGIRLAEAVNQAGGRYLAALAKGQRLVEERVAYRIKIAGRTTENRYQDMTFRVFRNDALQKYRATFDLAQRYVFLAATAYDYEANLLGTDSRGGRAFLTDIIRQRALGQMLNGSPVIGRSGLADPLARMGNNFDVLKTQLGFNNPQTETGRFSLRNELLRLRDSSDADWRANLMTKRVANLWDIPEFRRYCRSFAPESAGPQPGLVIRFSTTVTAGQNFFTWPLGGGDSSYDSSRFATKVRSAGIWFSGYNGLGLSQTPRVYLVPAGADILSSPTPNDFVTRGWRVVDQALPVPFPIGANRLSDPSWIPVNDSLGGSFADIRRFSSFRAYHDSGFFNPAEATSDSRLIGRSVANTDWLLIIPGQTFLANANQGLDLFINSVSDIKLFFQTYSYSGN